MNSNNVQSRIAVTAITAHLLVKIDATGKAAIAGASDKAVGSVLQDCAIGKACDIALLNGYPCHDLMVGNATAIVPGDEVEQLAGGQIGKFGSGTKVGVAIQGSVEAGSIIEVMVY